MLGTALTGATLLAPSAAQAGVSVDANGNVTFTYDENFTTEQPASTSPYLTAQISSIASGVRILLTSSLENSSEFFGQVKLNIEPNLQAGTANF